MALDIVRIHTKTFRGAPFKFAEVRGTPADHASWWSFDDEQELRDRWWHPAPGETVLDIGAAFGSYALPALALGARVVCFSPADFDTELLQANLALNPELAARCLIARDGLYSKVGWFDPDHSVFVEDGQVNGDQAPELYGMIGSRDDGGANFPKRQLLRVRSLDDYIAERPGIEHIGWMKIDVEGAELEVLKGAERVLRFERPKILVENHDFHDAEIGIKVRDYLVGLGVGYVCDGPHKHCSVSHSFFQVKP